MKCTFKGCSGTIDKDGTCEDCGRAAKGAPSLLSQISSENAQATGAPIGDIMTGTSSFPSSRSTSSYPSARAGTISYPSPRYEATVGTTATKATKATSKRMSSRSSTTRGSSSRRKSLGGGMVNLPSVVSQDPMKLIMSNPEVPLNKRRCPQCDSKVNRTKGFCPNCAAPYNFEPSLKAGDLISDKIMIKGPIAFGGLGWIYLGWDTLLSRWVVLKGLLNAKDEAAAAAAVTERRFLAAVKHPKIVGIYDFVQHGSESFIVMEYVGGRTIESLRREHDVVDVYEKNADQKTSKPISTNVLRKEVDIEKHDVVVKKKGVMPIEEACAYIIGILPAFAHLHEKGIVYCDFKPENFMLEEDDVKLIDMGGARKIDDPDGDIFGTRGFMAPEASDDPIAVSDLYSVGRALATLTMDFAHQGEYEFSLPSPVSQPLLAQWESFQRFLLRATHPDPDERFQSANEMSDQLLGVLREIAAYHGEPKPFDSVVFGPDNLIYPDDFAAQGAPLARALPWLRVDPSDPGAAEAARILSITREDARLDALQKACGSAPVNKPVKSVELWLRLANELSEKNDFASCDKILDKLQADDPFEWKVQWERGKSYLRQKVFDKAIEEFERVYFEMPGELAPKLARAYALEAAGRCKEALELYSRVAKVDTRMASAIFGKARCLTVLGDPMGSFTTLNEISESHSLHGQSKLRAARYLIESKNFNIQVLATAAKAIEVAFTEGAAAKQLAGVLLLKASLIANTAAVAHMTKEMAVLKIFGIPIKEFDLRIAAENHFRQAARMAENVNDKIHWVDMANRARPRTLF